MASLNHSHRQICRGSAPVPTPDATRSGQPDRGNQIGATISGQPYRGNHGGIAPTRYISYDKFIYSIFK